MACLSSFCARYPDCGVQRITDLWLIVGDGRIPTGPSTCSSCRPFVSGVRRGWLTQIPLGHPCWSLPSTRDTCKHQSSFEPLRPERLSVRSLRSCALSAPYLLWSDWLLRCFRELLYCLTIVSQIGFAANKNDGESLAEVEDLGNPLRPDISIPALFHSGRATGIPSLERCRASRESR